MSKNAESLTSVRKKVTHTHELISTVYHEAGHTIYALLHFMMARSVRVFPDKKTQRIEGFTNYYSLNADTIEDLLVLADHLNTEVGLSYAGLVAEKYQYKLHSGSDKFPSFLSDGSVKDLKEASDLIKKYQIVPPGKKRYNYKKRMIRKATREIQEYWSDVTIIAHALFQKKRINFNDIKLLLTTKSENKDFWKERLKIIENFYEKTILDEQEFKIILSI